MSKRGTHIGTVYGNMTFGRIDCYEHARHGDEAPLVIVVERNGPLASEQLDDCWDMETVELIAEECDYAAGVRAVRA